MPLWRQTLRGMLSGRALVWSGLAVAIGLMIAFLEPNKPQKGVQQGQQVPCAAEARKRHKRPCRKAIARTDDSGRAGRRAAPTAGLDRLAEKSSRRQWRPRVASQETADKVAKKSSVEERRSLADKDKSTELRFAQAKQEVVRQLTCERLPTRNRNRVACRNKRPREWRPKLLWRRCRQAPQAGEGGSRGAGAGSGQRGRRPI